MTTTEKNKLIAEFMQLEVFYGTHVRHETTSKVKITVMKYHSSWDWLMPVVEKIESLSEVNYKIEISHYTYIDTLPRIIYRKGTRIENTYNAVVDFILWYNKQNPA